MKFIIAPNAFKNNLSGSQVTDAIEQGIRSKFKDALIIKMPIADGGDGTMGVLVDYLGGERRGFTVSDPLGRPVAASIGLVDDGLTAVVELAEASGIRHLSPQELDPMAASTYGTGQLVKEALSLGVHKIILSLGGSATIDAGIGLLKALDFRVLDVDGQSTSDLNKVHQILYPEEKYARQLLDACTFVFLSDVENPLLGANGAVAVYGPQKGTTEATAMVLEKGMKNIRDVIKRHYNIDIDHVSGAGAAGGCGAVLPLILKGKSVSGISYVIDTLNLEVELADADVLFTGEGGIDMQTGYGKGSYVIARLAKKYRCKTIAITGAVDNDLGNDLADAFDTIMPIQHGPCTIDEAMENSFNNIIRTIANLCALL